MILVTGGTGFVGRHLVEALLKSSRNVRCLVRSMREGLFPPGVELAPGDVTCPETLPRALSGARAVVHLVAVIREKDRNTFQKVNVEGTRNLLLAAETAGVRRFVHMSALGAEDDPAYRYAYSKWQGEEAVRQSPLDWTVLRPSLVYGKGFGFFDRLRQSLQMAPPFLVPLPGGGRTTFQPMAVEDLVRCVLLSLDLASFYGRTLDLGGPEHLTYARMLDILLEVLGEKRIKVNVPLPLVRLAAPLMGLIMKDPPVTSVELKQLDRDNVTDAAAVEKIFGFRPRPLREGIRYLAGA